MLRLRKVFLTFEFLDYLMINTICNNMKILDSCQFVNLNTSKILQYFFKDSTINFYNSSKVIFSIIR